MVNRLKQYSVTLLKTHRRVSTHYKVLRKTMRRAKAEARFKEISEAYSVLSDQETRTEYDQVRAMGTGARFSAGGSGGAGGFEDVFGGMFGGGGRGGRTSYSSNNFEDLLGGMFGGGGGFGSPSGGFRGYGGPTKGADIAQLREDAQASLGPTFRALVDATDAPFMQPIVDLRSPKMVFGRAVLLGDAASVPRPHTAGSTAKAAANAHALALALSSTWQSGATIDSALKRWENQQLQRGRLMTDLGISLGDRVMNLAR